jgi:hypothetical protein
MTEGGQDFPNEFQDAWAKAAGRLEFRGGHSAVGNSRVAHMDVLSVPGMKLQPPGCASRLLHMPG